MEENNDRPVPLGVKLFWAAFIAAIGIAIAAYALRGNPDRWTYIQTVVNALALAAVAWTAVLTLRTRQAMIQQTNVNILPVFEVFIRVKGAYIPNAEIHGAMYANSYIEIKNIGRGTALNIEIDSLYVKTNWGGLSPLGEPLWFERVTSLAPGEMAVVKDIQKDDKSNVNIPNYPRRDLLALLVTPKALADYELAIRFTDMLGNEYAQAYRLGRSGTWPEMVQPSKAVRKIMIKASGRTYGHRQRTKLAAPFWMHGSDEDEDD